MVNKILIPQSPSEIENRQSTYHFIIDFVKMNFTDFLYNVFMLERYEAEACRKRDRNRGRVSRVPFELKLRQISASIRGESVGSSDLNGHCLFESQALMKSLLRAGRRGGNRTAEKHKDC